MRVVKTATGFWSVGMDGGTAAAAEVTAGAMRPKVFTGGSPTGTNLLAGIPVIGGSEGVFMAPPSGAVMVHLSMYVKSQLVDKYAMGGVLMFTGGTPGAGTPERFADDSTMIINATTSWMKLGSAALCDGLVPGDEYNVYAFLATNNITSTASGSINTITIQPCL